MQERLLRDTEAAELLGVKPATMRRWRFAGGGPKFYKIGGAVRYSQADLDEWLGTRRRSSTADPGVSDAA